MPWKQRFLESTWWKEETTEWTLVAMLITVSTCVYGFIVSRSWIAVALLAVAVVIAASVAFRYFRQRRRE